jgi:hypothetical protein
MARKASSSPLLGVHIFASSSFLPFLATSFLHLKESFCLQELFGKCLVKRSELISRSFLVHNRFQKRHSYLSARVQSFHTPYFPIPELQSLAEFFSLVSCLLHKMSTYSISHWRIQHILWHALLWFHSGFCQMGCTF